MSTEHTISAKDDEIRDRRARVWSMRVEGMTVREIAEQLRKEKHACGVATIQRDLDAIREELDNSTKFHAETDRVIASERLDKVARKLIAAVEVVDETTLSSLAGAIVRVEERRAKLLGLDAATKTELTGANGGPLEVDARDTLLRKLAGLAACETSEIEASADSGATEP